MKTIKKNSLILLSLLLIFSFEPVNAVGSNGKKKGDQQSYITIRGKVVDAETGIPLVFSTVAVSETNVAVVTNIDGEFTIKIGEAFASKNLEFIFLGYKTKSIPISSMRENGPKNTVRLESAPIPIKEIVVKPVNPEDIVYKAVSGIDKNYETVPNLMTAFYRETIRKNRTYVSIGEAVVEIFKAPYNSDIRFDNVRIYKGRKSTDVQKMDTVLFKLEGGPVNTLELDIAKNTELVLTVDAMKNYDYSLKSVIEIDGRPHYVIGFKQKPFVETPLFMGEMYIDMDSYAISEAVFGFNLEDKAAASSIFIKKKPLGMQVTPELVTYRVKFRQQGNKWHFEYARAEVKFKVNWKKKLFNTYYTTMSEIAITDRTDQEVIKFAGKDRLKYSDIFSDKVSAFTDPEFWGDYNVIEPDQSIDAAIRRLSRKLKFSDIKDQEK
jgi:hypothetical protein